MGHRGEQPARIRTHRVAAGDGSDPGSPAPEAGRERWRTDFSLAQLEGGQRSLREPGGGSGHRTVVRGCTALLGVDAHRDPGLAGAPPRRRRLSESGPRYAARSRADGGMGAAEGGAHRAATRSRVGPAQLPGTAAPTTTARPAAATL